MRRPKRRKPDPTKRAEILEKARRAREERAQGYREKALAILPHVCGRCGREFSGKNLRELTVHHKDHNHDNNPPDGSNWELLCVYCHDDEHRKSGSSGYHHQASREVHQDGDLEHNPFEGLKGLVKPDDD
jgi:hypothetical protein